MSARYAIVIPAVDNSEQCQSLLSDLLASIVIGEYTCPIVVCWDNVSPETIESFESKFPFISSLPFFGDACLNFAANSNRGLRFVHQELGLGAFLVNMDVCLPHRKFLEMVINEGVSSPLARHVDGTAREKAAMLNALATQRSEDGGCSIANQNRLIGFCLWISKTTLSTIGYLDEINFKASFEDDDFCIRACLAGLPCTQHWLQVHHEMKGRGEKLSTTNAYDLEQLVDHFHRFRKKWSIPFDTERDDIPNYILSHHKWCDDWKCS